MFCDFCAVLLGKCFRSKRNVSVCLLGLSFSERQSEALSDPLFREAGLTCSPAGDAERQTPFSGEVSSSPPVKPGGHRGGESKTSGRGGVNTGNAGCYVTA